MPHLTCTHPKKLLRLQPLVLCLGIATISLGVSVPTFANTTQGYVSQTPRDANAPIASLERLTSLDDSTLEVTVPNIHRFQTNSGVPVAFVQTHALPIVDASLTFNAGSARDSDIRADGQGIANMTAIMLTQGTTELDEDAFINRSEMLGINLGSRAYKDMFILSLRSLSEPEYLEPASELWQQLLTEPRFDETVLQRNQAQLIRGLQQQQQNPNYLAQLAFTQTLYGDHPYATPSTGTPTSIASLTSHDLRAFKDRFLVSANASLALTGDLSLAQAKALANTLTEPLARGERAPALPEPSAPSHARHLHIPFDSSQTVVIMGQLADKRSRDAETLRSQSNFNIGNEILAGGGFNARLMTEIRQNRGYTYGISGGSTPMISRGSYQVRFSTQSDNASDAINATLVTINNTLAEGVTANEVTLTKDNFVNSFPMSFASNASINGLLGMMQFYDLPHDYLDTQLSYTRDAEVTSVNTALRDRLEPNKFLIVTVGEEAPEVDIEGIERIE